MNEFYLLKGKFLLNSSMEKKSNYRFYTTVEQMNITSMSIDEPPVTEQDWIHQPITLDHDVLIKTAGYITRISVIGLKVLSN